MSCSGCISVDEFSSLGPVCVCPFESGERGAECGPAEFCSSVIGDFPACVALTKLLPGRVEGLDFLGWGAHSVPFCRCPREGQREGAARRGVASSHQSAQRWPRPWAYVRRRALCQAISERPPCNCSCADRFILDSGSGKHALSSKICACFYY